MKNLEKVLFLVKSGQMEFREFVTKTSFEFRKMACYLTKRWAPPEWHTVEDVEQDLYIGAWTYIPSFNPTLGTTFSRFIVFNSMSFAKRRLHKARGVTIAGSPDKKISRFEIPISFLGEEEGDGEAMMQSLLFETARAEEALIAEEERKFAVGQVLKNCETIQERYAVLAIREAGSLDGAAQVLYDDIDHRIKLRLGSEERAERFVFRHAIQIANRMQANG